jgi:hypothetical protein
MFIIIACEYSNIVAQAFRNKGHKVLSVDVLPNSQDQTNHIQDDIFNVLKIYTPDLLIGFPPCTYLCKAQIFRLYSSPGRWCKMLQSVDFFKKLFYCNAPQVALENPIGILTKQFRPPDQITSPSFFGSNYRKDVCLWLKNLPPVISTVYNNKNKSVMNHVNGQMSQAQKSHIKSKFFPELAEAMANQWG